MTSIYIPGDIVFFRNVVFNDPDGKERIDIRIAGHPFLVLNSVENLGDKCCALIITSRRSNKICQYSLAKHTTIPRLKKESFVNLNKVFEFYVDRNTASCCHLKIGHFNRICEKIPKNNY